MATNCFSSLPKSCYGPECFSKVGTIPRRMTFVVVWYVEQGELNKHYLMNFYTEDGTFDIRDIKTNKLFLKRTKLEGINVDDMFIGNKIFIFFRQFTIVDYCDTATKEYLEPRFERALIVIKPSTVKNLSRIIKCLERDFKIVRGTLASLNEKVAELILPENTDETARRKMIDALKSRQAVALLVMGMDAKKRMRSLIETNLSIEDEPFRGEITFDNCDCGFHATDNIEKMRQEAAMFFSNCPTCSLPASTNEGKETALCIIKPHACKAGIAGSIMDEIVCNGFSITGFGVYWLSRTQAKEFLQAFQFIFSERDFADMVDQFSLGQLFVMELCDSTGGNDALNKLQQLIGPSDPEIARNISPNSIRAKYGVDRIRNAVYCTELAIDVPSETNYFFKYLQ